MGIDRIGKHGPVAPVPEVAQPSRASTAAEPFRVAGLQSPPQVDPTRAAHAPLERLRTGEIDVAGYLDLKVEEATSHLSALPPVELAAIRSALRDQLASDPSLVDLVHAATGELPLPHDDD
jgi:hypothetical protein